MPDCNQFPMDRFISVPSTLILGSTGPGKGSVRDDRRILY